MRRVAQRVRMRPESAARQHEHAFLVGSHIDRATLERAEREAALSGVATHAVLLASGWVSQADYAAALARALGVGVALWDLAIEADNSTVDDPADEHGLPGLVRGQPCRVLNATNAAPAVVSRRVASLRARGFAVVLAPQFSIDAAREVHCRSQRIDRAVRGLLREQPAISAGTPARTWQVVAAAGTVGTALGGLLVFPEATLAALTGLIALPFLCVTLLRLVALRQVLARSPARKARKDLPRLADRSLPVYSILVPLDRKSVV